MSAATLESEHTEMEQALAQLQARERDAKSACQYAEAKISVMVTEKQELQDKVRSCEDMHPC